MCTIPGIGTELYLLEDAIRLHSLPVIIGRQALSDAERKLITLPERLGVYVHLYLQELQPFKLEPHLGHLVYLVIKHSPRYPEQTTEQPKGSRGYSVNKK